MNGSMKVAGISRSSLPWAVSCILLMGGTVSAQESKPPVRLEVGWVSMEPHLPPPTSAKTPREEGWPEPGSTMHWVAHVLNRGTEAAPAVPYSWRVDGNVVDHGVATFAPGKAEIRFAWGWTFERHLVSFEIRPPGALKDATTSDNQVTVVSDALSLGLWVERGLYDWMADEDRPGFERWAQEQIDGWNAILARGVYPTAPEGALDRIRLDRVVVIPEGSRPKNEERDRDLNWFFPTHFADSRFLQRNVYPVDSTIVLHELLHQRGLVDLYAYTVTHGGFATPDNRVDISENGKLVAGTFLMPSLGQSSSGIVLYKSPINGIMGGQYVSTANLTEFSVNGLNLRAGHRTPLWLDQWGNLINGYSSVADPDSYVWKLPEKTELTVADEKDVPLPGAAVDVYLDHNPDTYSKRYGAAPDRTLATDSRGVVVLPGDLLDGLPPKKAAVKPQVIILGVRTSSGRGYAFLPVLTLNMLYFRGGAEHAESRLRLNMHPW